MNDLLKHCYALSCYSLPLKEIQKHIELSADETAVYMILRHAYVAVPAFNDSFFDEEAIYNDLMEYYGISDELKDIVKNQFHHF